MKTALSLFLCIFIMGPLLAQNDDDFYRSNRDYNKEETLFNSMKIYGAFAGPIFEYNFIGDDFEVSGGGGGGLVFKHLFVGAYGLGTVSESVFDEDFDNIDRLEMAHGGLWMGYTYEQHKLLHLYSSVKLGLGALNVDLNDEIFDSGDAIFVLSPEIGLELNIFRFFKIAGTVGYRFVNGINESASGLNSDSLNGLTTSVSLRFGFFGRRRR